MQWHPIFRISAWLILLVHIFERPIWTLRADSESWSHGDVYPSYQIPYFPYWVAILLTALLLGILWISVGLELGYKDRTSSVTLTTLFAALLALKSIGVFVYIVNICIGKNPIFSFSPVEAAYILLVEYRFESNIGYLLRTFPQFVGLIVVLACFVCTYTAIGFLIFNPDSQESQEYFNVYGSAVWNMLMVLNGSNWPVPMIPAFTINHAYCIYFFVYIIVLGWGLLNLVLGFVYFFFQTEQSNITRRQREIKASHMLRAFRALDSEGKGVLNYAQVDSFLEEVYVYYEEASTPPSAAERHELIKNLDPTGKGVIDEMSFLDVETKCLSSSLRGIRIPEKRKHVMMQDCAQNALQQEEEGEKMGKKKKTQVFDGITRPEEGDRSIDRASAPSYSRWRRVVRFIDSVSYDIWMDCVLWLLALLFVTGLSNDTVFYVYYSVSVAETLTKLLVKGYFRYHKSSRNSVDGGFALILTLILVIRSARGLIGSMHGDYGIRLTVILRMLLLPRNIIVTSQFRDFRHRYRAAFKHVEQGAAHISFLLLLLFTSMYWFAALGQQIFGGAIVKQGDSYVTLSTSLYGQSGYWPLNFNDMLSSLTTMFVLLHVNNMHVVASGFEAVSGQWSKLFFALWYAVGVLFLLNIVTAAFLSEFTSYLETVNKEKKQLAVKNSNIPDADDSEHKQYKDGAPEEKYDEEQQNAAHINNSGTVAPFTQQNPMHRPRGTPGAPRNTLKHEKEREKSNHKHEEESKNQRDQKQYKEEEEDITSYAKAALLVVSARDGENRTFVSTKRSLFCFQWRSRLSPVLRFATFVLVAIRIFERPLWTYRTVNWDDAELYPLSEVPFISATAAIAIKLPILLVLLAGLCLEHGYKESSSTLLLLLQRSTVVKHISVMRTCRYLLTLYCIAQILILSSCAINRNLSSSLVTTTSAANLLYLFWFNRRSLFKLRIVFRILPQFSVVLFVFFIMVLMFAGVGPYIFLKTEDDSIDDDYFYSFSQSVWSVFVAITSSDYPNQVIPAYRKHREVVIYFVSFICIGAYWLLNLIIVIVVTEFQKASQNNAELYKLSRRTMLTQAFEALDTGRVGYLTKETITQLLDELRHKYAITTIPPAGAARDIMTDIVDVNGDGYVTLQDFVYFVDVLRIKISLNTRETFMEQYAPEFTRSRVFAAIKAMVDSRQCDLVMDTTAVLLIVINLIINRNDEYRASSTSVYISITVLLIFITEAVMKLMVHGYTHYFHSFRNCIDFAVIIGMVIVFIAGASYDKNQGHVNGFTILMRILQMIRVVIFPRNIRFIADTKHVNRMARLLRKIFVKVYTLSIIFICTGYWFANIGVYFYGGTVVRYGTDDQLSRSGYAANAFWSLNFNDFTSAAITLFCCLHVSDFDVIASGFVAVTNIWSRMYFAAWYVIGVLLMLNLVKSFFLGEFLIIFSKKLFVSSGSSSSSSDSRGDSVSVSNVMHGTAEEEEPRDDDDVANHCENGSESRTESDKDTSSSPLNDDGIAAAAEATVATIVNNKNHPTIPIMDVFDRDTFFINTTTRTEEASTAINEKRRSGGPRSGSLPNKGKKIVSFDIARDSTAMMENAEEQDDRVQFHASTSNIKGLSHDELEMLKRRLNALALRSSIQNMN